ncbi:MAG: hypothetical protein FWC89_09555 [Defluviitaleaceae bacterium]|nr:hypothetical protein [Defluviitaleaceae bacterium]
MTKKIDLLPEWARNAKTTRKQIKILAVAQTAIFLILAAITIFLLEQNQQAQAATQELTSRLTAFTSSPAEAAEALQAARAQANQTEELRTAALPPQIIREWLTIITQATPENATLTQIDYNQQELLIIATATNINTIETHRANLSHLFQNVRQGRITRVQEGEYTYEIRATTTGG